jgi:hypothetical protein
MARNQFIAGQLLFSGRLVSLLALADLVLLETPDYS